MKQEDIRELLETILVIAPVPMDDVKDVAGTILQMMESQGVVIRKDRELPIITQKGWYYLVESLIKEGS